VFCALKRRDQYRVMYRRKVQHAQSGGNGLTTEFIGGM